MSDGKVVSICEARNKRLPVEEEAEDQELVWQCPCGNSGFYLYSGGVVGCPECGRKDGSIIWGTTDEKTGLR